MFEPGQTISRPAESDVDLARDNRMTKEMVFTTNWSPKNSSPHSGFEQLSSYKKQNHRFILERWSDFITSVLGTSEM